MESWMTLEESSTAYISSLWLARASKAASIAAFVVQSLELFNHIPEEIEYLWRTPFRLVTYLYAFSRYFAFCVQIVNLTLSELIRTNPTPKLCFSTFIVEVICGQFMATCIETILLIRVHALYNCSRWTGLFLLAVMISGVSLEVTGTALAISDMRPSPKVTICSPKRWSVAAIVPFVMGAGLVQATLLVLTVNRVILYRKTGMMKTPVVSLMFRDSIFVFLILTINLVVFTTAAITVHNENALLFNVAFSWYTALVSIVGCRLVLNMRKLAVQHPRDQQSISDSVQLSSLFEGQSNSAPGDNIASSRI